MKTFLAALLVSSQVALADRPERRYACCVLEEKTGEMYGINGTVYMWQQDGDLLKVSGELSMNANDVMGEDGESRYMGISENAQADTCEDPGSLWPFPYDDMQGCALQPVQFNVHGMANYRSNDGPASLFVDSIVGHSLSLYDDETKDGEVDACCTIMEMTEEDYYAATSRSDASGNSNGNGKNQGRGRGLDDDDSASGESGDEDDSESDESGDSGDEGEGDGDGEGQDDGADNRADPREKRTDQANDNYDAAQEKRNNAAGGNGRRLNVGADNRADPREKRTDQANDNYDAAQEKRNNAAGGNGRRLNSK